MSEVRIREAVEADLPQIVACWRDLITLHQGLNPSLYATQPQGEVLFWQASRRYLSEATSEVMVAEAVSGTSGGPHLDGLLGYIIAREGLRPPWYTVRRVGMVLDLYVRPEARRQGVAQRLLRAAEGAFTRRGLGWMQACFDPMNDSATGFWTGQGFRPLLVEGYRALGDTGER